jgi:HK97 gp10 family phage protein
MAKGSFQVTGIKELSAALKKRANLDDVKRVVQMNGSEMARAMNAHAPSDTGNLKRMIKLSMHDDGFTVKVISGAEYAAYQEYGTRYQTGTPHVRPAYNQQRPKFLSDMKRLMK